MMGDHRQNCIFNRPRMMPTRQLVRSTIRPTHRRVILRGTQNRRAIFTLRVTDTK